MNGDTTDLGSLRSAKPAAHCLAEHLHQRVVVDAHQQRKRDAVQLEILLPVEHEAGQGHLVFRVQRHQEPGLVAERVEDVLHLRRRIGHD